MTAVVTTGEGRLLRTVQAVLRPGSPAELGLLLSPAAPASSAVPSVGPTAMRLLRDTIATGVVAALVRSGGWRRRPFLHADGRSEMQRLWEAMPELPLRYSEASYRLCAWLVGHPTELRVRTLGDAVLFRLAADAMARCGLDIQPLSSSPLVCLGHPAVVDSDDADWSLLLSPEGLAVLHGLHDAHVHRWVDTEVRKGAMTDPGVHARASRRQRAVADAFLDAIEGVQRRDHATFLFEAGAHLHGRPASSWLASLSLDAPLSARSEAADAAAGTLRVYERLGRWYDALATVPFFEPEYDHAQQTLAQWDPPGRAGLSTLVQLAEALASGRLLTPPNEESP